MTKSPLQKMRDLLAEDTRYPLEAYQFVREALQYAHEHLETDDASSDSSDCDFDEPVSSEVQLPEDFHDLPDEVREELETIGDELLKEALNQHASGRPSHISGQQLCEACRSYAIEQFGFLSRIVLESWEIRGTSDFGELVYNLIRIGQMKKSEEDRLEDFDDVYDFETAFDPHFEKMAIRNDVI